MHYSAPGKLMITGEWAVLEVGNPCIVAAVNRRSHAKIEKSDSIRLILKDYDIDLTGEYNGKQLVFENIDDKQKEKIIFIKGAIEAAFAYLGKGSNFTMTTWNEDTEVNIDGEQKKIGFGTSAAAVVAAVASVLAFDGIGTSERSAKNIIYKLSAIAHYFAQGKVGSAFDVAASTYGGAVLYKRFDPEWLSEEMLRKSVKEIAEEEWPHFTAEELKIPEDFILLIGWTKESASTSAMVKQMNEFKKNNPDKYKKTIDDVAHCAREAIYAWKDSDWEKLIIELQNNEQSLARLGKISGVNIETPDIKKLADIADESGGAGKLSGAGGGDCGIAVCFDEITAEKIKEAWNNAGLYIVDATVDREGVREE